MKIMVHTGNATFTGDIALPPDRTSSRLQDIMNNPAMMYPIRENPSDHVLLKDVKIDLACHEGVFSLDKPSMLVAPDQVELVYDVSEKMSMTESSVRAIYEKKQAKQQSQWVEIVTRFNKQISGLLVGGVEALSHQRVEKRFLAMTRANIEMFSPERKSFDLVFVLVNRDYIVSFRELTPNT